MHESVSCASWRGYRLTTYTEHRVRQCTLAPHYT
nr:MAG TPA: hypothetical protein [Caudoviricetes sp.]